MMFPDKSQPETQKRVIKAVVQGTKAQQPARRKFVNFLFAESPRDLGMRIGRDVVVPRLKLGLEEALNSFLAGMLWGNGSRPLGGIVAGTVLRSGSQPGVNYSQISTNQSALALAQAQTTTNKSTGLYSNVVCGTQQQAEFLLANMYEVFNQYHVVAVGDLYEMAGIKVAPADNAYGWYDLDGAKVLQSREGYEIDMPRPIRIHG